MKDEIKEINIKFPGQILDYVDTKEHLLELFNYITNLQIIEQQYSVILSENAELENKIINLQEENESLKELNICVGCNNNTDYKSRNEKAIEYIKQLGHSDWITFGRKILLEILNGGDEEC